MRLLIDGDVLLHKAAHAARTEVQWSPDCFSLSLDVKQAADECSSILGAWMDRHGADEVVLAFSDPSRRYFRHEFFPEYKAGRSRLIPGWESLVARVSRTWPSLVWPRLEADDVLGVVCTSENADGDILVSIDKDFRGVPCRLWNPDRPDEGPWDIDQAAADLFHLEQTLIGDRVDGFFGCPGIGKVRAARLLAEIEPELRWAAVVATYERAGKTAADALVQARLAHILRVGEYEPRTGEVHLWNPPKGV